MCVCCGDHVSLWVYDDACYSAQVYIIYHYTLCVYVCDGACVSVCDGACDSLSLYLFVIVHATVCVYMVILYFRYM